MRFEVITLFPEVFPGPLGAGVVGRALSQGLLEVGATDLRHFGLGERRQVDDVPFGGGPGMVLKPEPLFAAVREARHRRGDVPAREVLLSAHGRRLDQQLAAELARVEAVLLVCGRYQGVDERVRLGLELEEISVGDFVVSGGELPAMLLIEAVARLLPGALGDPESRSGESFSGPLPEHPHYTRPAVFEGLEVPEVLRSGDHARISRWREQAAAERERRLRPGATPAGEPELMLDPARGREGATARLGGAR